MFYIRVSDVLLVLLTISVTDVRGCLQQVNAPATPTPASLFSTHYPRDYDSDATCSWRIFSTTLGARVYVHIVEADLDNYNNQCADSLVFYNDVTPGEAPLHRVCGSESDMLIKSRGEQLYLNFTTDSERTDTGFYIIYWAALEDEDHPSCNEVVRLGDSPQLLHLSSRAFRSKPCAVLIDAGVCHVVVLKPGSRSSEDLLDCDENFIRVFDGSSPEGSSLELFCSEDLFSWYRSSGRYLLVQTSLLSAPGRQFTVIAHREPVTDRCNTNDVPLIEVPFRPVYMWIPYHLNDSEESCPVTAVVRSMGSYSDLQVTVLGSNVNSQLECSVTYIQVASYADELSTNYFKPKCDDKHRPFYQENVQSLVLGESMAGNGSKEINSSKYLVKLQTKGYNCGNETNVILVESDIPQIFIADIPVFGRTLRCRFLFNTSESTNHIKVEFKGNSQCNGVIYKLYDGTPASSGYLGNYTCGSLTRPVFRSNSSSLLVELEAGGIDVVTLNMEYSFVDTSEEDLLFEPRSTYDPRVTLAIGLIVGLANGVGAVFLLAMVIIYFRSRSSSEKEEIEEHYQEMVEEK